MFKDLLEIIPPQYRDWFKAVNGKVVSRLEVREITLKKLRDWLKVHEPITLIDLREPSGFAAGHLENAQNIPLGNLRQSLSTLVGLKNSLIICICRNGQRSNIAAQILRENGFQYVYPLSGGMMAWRKRFKRKHIVQSETHIKNKDRSSTKALKDFFFSTLIIIACLSLINLTKNFFSIYNLLLIICILIIIIVDFFLTKYGRTDCNRT